MVSLLNECGMTLERRRLRGEKQAVEMETQRERLSSNLLRAISRFTYAAHKYQRERDYFNGKKYFT